MKRRMAEDKETEKIIKAVININWLTSISNDNSLLKHYEKKR